ncbi:MAG: flippase [Patescibacteria group bacterium]|jgi:O-antigen/teichoic acid export membrane protein
MNDNKKIENIAKNTSYLTMALILQKVLSFSYFVLLARNLGPESLGKYYFAISFTTIFAVFIDLGLVNYLTRETAKTKEKSPKLLANILGLKTITSLVSLLAVFVFINILGGYDSLSRELVYISAICMVLDSFTLTFFGSARGFHNLKFESIASVIFQVIVLACGWLFLILKFDLRIIMLSLVLASLFNFFYSASILRFKIKMPIKISFDFPFIKNILIFSLPFALFGVFQRLYTYLDSVLLSFFSGDYYVGIYQISFKIIFALQFLPMAFIASLYPAMSYYWLNNREQLLIAFKRAIDYLLLISIPISTAVFLLSDKILLIFKNDYSSANWPLKISILALIFIFLNFPIGSLLNACDRQSKNTQNMLISLIFAVILNIILIPRFQAIGASIVVVLSNFLMFILGIIECRKISSYRFKSNLMSLAKILMATLFMAIFIFVFKSLLNIFILSFIAMIIYFSFLLLFGAIKKADINYIKASFKTKNDLV